MAALAGRVLLDRVSDRLRIGEVEVTGEVDGPVEVRLAKQRLGQRVGATAVGVLDGGGVAPVDRVLAEDTRERAAVGVARSNRAGRERFGSARDFLQRPALQQDGIDEGVGGPNQLGVGQIVDRDVGDEVERLLTGRHREGVVPFFVEPRRIRVLVDPRPPGPGEEAFDALPEGRVVDEARDHGLEGRRISDDRVELG